MTENLELNGQVALTILRRDVDTASIVGLCCHRVDGVVYCSENSCLKRRWINLS